MHESFVCHLPPLRQGLSEAWRSPVQLDWLASKPWGTPAPTPLSSPGFMSMCHWLGSSVWVLGDHAWVLVLARYALY